MLRTVEARSRLWCFCFALLLLQTQFTVHAISADQSDSPPDLPKIVLEDFPPEIRSEVERAYDAVKANPNDAILNGKLGMVFEACNPADDKAEASYRRAHLLDPTAMRWSYYLGVVLANEGKFEEAVLNLRDALRSKPEYLPARVNLGECLLASGKWQGAAELFEALAKEDPNNPHAHFGLARVRAARSDLNGAAESFRKACELYPQFAAAHYGLARIYERLGNKEKFSQELSLYTSSKGLGPPFADPLLADVLALTALPSDGLRQAAELANRGELPEAAAAYERLLAENPKLEKAHVSLISLYGRLGQVEKAEGHFQAAVRLDPHDPDCYFEHGLLMAGKEDYSDAEVAFRKVLEINPLYPEGHTHLGYMLEAQGKPDEAVAEYEKATTDFPDDARAQFALGRMAVNQGRYAEGIRLLLISVRTGRDDDRPAYLYALGAAYARAGDRENALQYLRRAGEGAEAHGQTKLKQEIDADLKELETEPGAP